LIGWKEEKIRKPKLKVVVIGNGIGGFSAGSTIRRLDDQCEVTLIASEAHPLYSACVLPDYISGKISRKQVFVKSRSDYRNLGIRAFWGLEAKEIDPNTKKIFLDDGRDIDFDRLILATGSEALFFGELKKGLFKLKTLKDADEIKRQRGKKAVVIGAGPIGVEIGIALLKRGYEVTIVEMMDKVLPLGLDTKGAEKVKSMLEERGIEVLLNERSEKVLGSDRVEGLVTSKRQIDCDTLLWAVGMRPRVELAREAGIVLGERGGIRVNSHMETNIEGIYACGDCVESNDMLTGEPYPNLFWHNANRQGMVAGRNCLGKTTDYPGSQNILNVDVFGNHVAGFGFTEAALHRFENVKGMAGKLSDLSIIEKEKNGSYYRLVIVGDRCMGGQFINMSQNIGMLWSLMIRRRGMKELTNLLGNRELLCRKPWFYPIKPFFA